jgi:mono/diheme cytochrome c family protein
MANEKRGMGGRVIRVVVVLLALIEAARLGAVWGRRLILRPEETAAARGFRVAHEAGCFACHGPAGEGGTTNPGSEEGTVPPFIEQTQMMYAKTPQALREYILDGAPAKKRDDPDYRANMERAALQMPAYRDRLTTGQVDDLVVYLRAVSGLLAPTEALAVQGAALALKYDCFACHGPLGAGGVGNPGSFKGYVPGFWGEDFDDLVHDDDELRTWLAEGKLDRIAEHPIGRIFFSRQRLKMPAYGRFLSADDITALAAFVRWVRAGDWRHGLE